MASFLVGVDCPEYCDQRQIRDRDAVIEANSEKEAISLWIEKRKLWIRDDEKHLVKVLKHL